jgi:hypothetical protein
MSEICALCFEEEVERSKQESAAAMANAAFMEIAAKIANLKVSENLQRLKTAVAPELHPLNDSPDTSGRGGEEKSITLSILEPSSWADDGSSIPSAQSLSEDPKVLPDILEFNDVPRSSGNTAPESESAVHSVQSNHKANSNAPPTPKSSASRRSSASSAASYKSPPKPTSSALMKSSVAPSTATSVSGSSISKSAPKRPPPPPPPPRTIKIAASNKSAANGTNDVHHDMSMEVLNPHPEPELEGEFPFAEIMVQQPSFAPEVMSVPQRSFSQSFAPEVMSMPQRSFSQPDGMFVGMMTQSQISAPETSMPQRPLSHLEGMTDVQQPDYQHEEHSEVNKSKEWMKYTSKASRRETTEDGNDNVKKSKMFRRESKKKLDTNEQIKSYTVRQMPFTDQFGDFGHYTGQVDDEGRPDGKGIMKYENGVFYEGTWTNGGQDKLAASQYDRIRGGFTSWSGKGKSGVKSGGTLPWNSRKNDAHDASEKTNVRGMEWTDLNGDSGRYTGEVDNDQLPHGSGIMRYDFGLIAEGEWVHGVLKEGPHDRMISAAAMNGGQSVVPRMPINSGMSVGPGAMGYASGAVSVLGVGGMSVAPPLGFSSGIAPPVVNPMQYRGMNASQHAMLAHQNAMMKMHGGAAGSVFGGGGSVYGGGGSVYGGAGMIMPMQQMQPSGASVYAYHGGGGSVFGGTGMVMPMQQMQPMQIQSNQPMQHAMMHQQQQHQQQQQQQQQQHHRPPIANIVLKK